MDFALEFSARVGDCRRLKGGTGWRRQRREVAVVSTARGFALARDEAWQSLIPHPLPYFKPTVTVWGTPSPRSICNK
jgi:hypothetical protein